MITPPTIYADDETQISSDLTPQQRRQIVWQSWFTANLTPQQWLNNLVFSLYYGGSSAPAWVSGNAYNYGDDVLYLDNAIYECTNLNGVTSSTPPNQDTANWIKILDTFVGIAERVKYTGQKIMLEYLLNRYFNVGSVNIPWFGSRKWYNNINYKVGQVVYYTDGNLYTCILDTAAFEVPTNATYWVINAQIYIVGTQTNVSEFWMATTPTGAPQSYMPLDTRYSGNWMPITTSAYQPSSFTVYVPATVAAAITAAITAVIPGSQDTYVELITSILNKYVRFGREFTVTTY